LSRCERNAIAENRAQNIQQLAIESHCKTLDEAVTKGMKRSVSGLLPRAYKTGDAGVRAEHQQGNIPPRHYEYLLANSK
jgi:hypothetical protein